MMRGIYEISNCKGKGLHIQDRGKDRCRLLVLGRDYDDDGFGNGNGTERTASIRNSTERFVRKSRLKKFR